MTDTARTDDASDPAGRKALPPVRVSRQQQDELAILAQQGPSRIAKLAAHLRSAYPPPLTAGEFRAELEKIIDSPASGAVENQLITLGILRNRRRRSAAIVLDAVTKGLLRTDWDDSHHRAWEAVRAPLDEVLSSDALTILVKAIDLSYDYPDLLESARILVDIRPIFDDTRSEIQACIVSRVLRVQYFSDDGRHSLSLVVDEDDILMLRTACDEALRKSRSARVTMEESAKVRTITPGSEENERA